MRRRFLLVALLAVAGTALAGYRVYQQRQPHTVVGSPTVEFDPNLEPGARPRADPVAQRLPWPTYAFDAERTHFGAGVRLRPPFNAMTFVLWGAPGIALLAGLAAAVIARRRRPAAPAPLTDAERQRLADLLKS